MFHSPCVLPTANISTSSQYDLLTLLILSNILFTMDLGNGRNFFGSRLTLPVRALLGFLFCLLILDVLFFFSILVFHSPLPNSISSNHDRLYNSPVHCCPPFLNFNYIIPYYLVFVNTFSI